MAGKFFIFNQLSTMLCICKSNSEIKSKIQLDLHVQIK